MKAHERRLVIADFVLFVFAAIMSVVDSHGRPLWAFIIGILIGRDMK